MSKKVKITKNLVESKINWALALSIIGAFTFPLPFGIWSACVYSKYANKYEEYFGTGKPLAIILLVIFDILTGIAGILVALSEL